LKKAKTEQNWLRRFWAGLNMALRHKSFFFWSHGNEAKTNCKWLEALING